MILFCENQLQIHQKYTEACVIVKFMQTALHPTLKLYKQVNQNILHSTLLSL